MKKLLFPSLLLLCVSFTACAVLKKEELAQVRAKKVSEPVVHKLQHKEPLLASDVIELSRHGVANEIIVHYIRRTGIAAPVRESEITHMRSSGVTGTIVNLVENESDKLEADRRALGQQTIDPAPPPPTPPVIPPAPENQQPAW